MSEDNDNVMYLIFREDLYMSTGKVAAQAGHAVQDLTENIVMGVNGDRMERYLAWKKTGTTKVCLRVQDLYAMSLLRERLAKAEIMTCTIIDEGRTEVQPGSITVMGIEPMPKAFMRQFVGDLKLL